MKGISVIVCCYNSAKRIEETLEYLRIQKSDTFKFEIILVNNNSSDNTVEVAEKYWNSIPSEIGFSIVDQPIPGLSFAREKGIETSKYNYLIFCDDDNSLDINYLHNAFNIFEANSDIAIIGGEGEFSTTDKVQDWFPPFETSYACGKQWSESCILNGVRDFVWGAGMCIRKDIITHIQKLGIKSFLADRKGKELSSGGDTELSYWVSKLGFKIYYTEELKFKHNIDHSRTSWLYLVKMYEGFARSNAILYFYEYHFFNTYSQISGRPIPIRQRFWHSYFYYSAFWLRLVGLHFNYYRRLTYQAKMNPSLYKEGSIHLLLLYFYKEHLRALIQLFPKFYQLNKKIKNYGNILSMSNPA
jgi:glycosyltransferase involved in cell wall biosynthesis